MLDFAELDAIASELAYKKRLADITKAFKGTFEELSYLIAKEAVETLNKGELPTDDVLLLSALALFYTNTGEDVTAGHFKEQFLIALRYESASAVMRDSLPPKRSKHWLFNVVDGKLTATESSES